MHFQANNNFNSKNIMKVIMEVGVKGGKIGGCNDSPPTPSPLETLMNLSLNDEKAEAVKQFH